ncbi:sunset domain-containing protein [Metabacillus arenae]|uniref:Uncharacterized protein n=1 Tax=Metabacillus arenae TaxID=2771434 RepID=A0A926NJF4_9BACI|nr:hypothetical protein [Metabacillus arenae]MBD1378966.1 hypothetical protein [Metabacillus arenae]
MKKPCNISLIGKGIFLSSFISTVISYLLSKLSSSKSTTIKEIESEQTNKDPLIKGNINAQGKLIYHVPEGQFYEITNAVEWFHTEEEANAAGYRRSQR